LVDIGFRIQNTGFSGVLFFVSHIERGGEGRLEYMREKRIFFNEMPKIYIKYTAKCINNHFWKKDKKVLTI
jgi:hypothetical protein